MLISTFPAQAFATNCYVVAPAEGEDCLVVDPGVGVLDDLAEVLQRHRLRPAAVLLTHAHIDHCWSVTPVCGAHGIAVSVHTDDRYRLRDPFPSHNPELVAMLRAQFGSQPWQEPDDVRTVTGSDTITVAGLSVEVLHAPGHTEGSVMFRLQGAPEQTQAGATVLSGDVLFAGSIGRTDLPGGDHEAMLRSLREQVLPMADDTLVLPGHGPATSIARERATNPYLVQLG